MTNKKIPILIIGFGSIGQRHYRNLKSLGFKNLTVYDPLAAGRLLKSVTQLKKLDRTTAKSFKIALIASPNHLHIKHALICARAGCHLFIEKPLSHSLVGLEELNRLAVKNKLAVAVGHNLRFHPCLKFIKKYLAGKKLGAVYSITHEAGSYLPNWRPGQDYRKNYAAKRDTGGGIILDDIHEFDLLFWLNDFSRAIKEKFIFNRSGALAIETEDNCLAIFEFKNKVLGLVKCDYLQQAYSRNLKIVGTKGNLRWDFMENKVWLETGRQKKNIFTLKNYDFNKTYLEEIRCFIDGLGKKGDFGVDLNQAILVLKHCLRRA